MRPYLRLASLAAAALLVSAGCGGGGAAGEGEQHPTRIGVLLSEGRSHWRNSIELALDYVNRAGGVEGRRLEAVFGDGSPSNLAPEADRFINDPSVAAVIGGETTSEAELLAGRFIAGGKVLVSPSATSASLFRAFGGRDYFWRTAESDVEQARYLMYLAAEQGGRVAALSPSDSYGATFFDWFGFFSLELGAQLAANLRYPSGAAACGDYVAPALAYSPSVLLAVPSSPDFALCVKEEVASRSPGTRVIFSDGAYREDLLASAALRLEGMEGVGPAPSPESGFALAYRERFSEEPPPYSANAFDAVLLLAYGLASSGGNGGAELAEGMKRVVSGAGAPAGADPEGVALALSLIFSGANPRVSGAGGPLAYDRELFTDPVTRSYRHWRIESGEAVDLATLLSSEADSEAAALSSVRYAASEEHRHSTAVLNPPAVGERTSLWAVIAAVSSGWQNYRHQADALAQYKFLRDNGLDDDHIVLILADDLAANPANPEPGAVRNSQGGENLYAGALIDYRLSEVTPDDLLRIIAGEGSDSLPVVISPDAGANVYVYLVGHGAYDGLHFGVSSPVELGGGGGEVLSPAFFASGLDYMAGQGRFRRMLVAIEACEAGVFGESVTTPGVALLTASGPFESSLAARWDQGASLWRADEFSAAFLGSLEEGMGGASFTETYEEVYRRVRGSHAGFYNVANWASPDEVLLNEFFQPISAAEEMSRSR